MPLFGMMSLLRSQAMTAGDFMQEPTVIPATAELLSIVL